MGILAALIANVNRDPKQRREPYTPDDFLPRFGDAGPPADQPKQTPNHMKAMAELLNEAFGGRDLRGTPEGEAFKRGETAVSTEYSAPNTSDGTTGASADGGAA